MKTYLEALTDLETLINTRAEAYASGHANNDWCGLPSEWRFFNGSNERCDAAVGPCSCGAWHDKADTLERALEIGALTIVDDEIEDVGSNQTLSGLIVSEEQ